MHQISLLYDFALFGQVVGSKFDLINSTFGYVKEFSTGTGFFLKKLKDKFSACHL